MLEVTLLLEVAMHHTLPLPDVFEYPQVVQELTRFGAHTQLSILACSLRPYELYQV